MPLLLTAAAATNSKTTLDAGGEWRREPRSTSTSGTQAEKHATSDIH